MTELLAEPPERWRLEVTGAVQGVGFRPFAYRLARRLGLSGFVLNSPRGVMLEAEGPGDALGRFRGALRAEAPARAVIQGISAARIAPVGEVAFRIRESEGSGAAAAVVLPDVATCADCLAELRDPADRRHRYPFTNCTNCGPRYSIVQGLPYDRARTTMARFAMCGGCRAEYEDPADRRFHAEPNACPSCGPRLSLLDAAGGVLARDEEALQAAAVSLRKARIVAVKGLGGFHLLVDARDEEAVRELRRRKRREAKPLAVMLSSVEEARRHARLTAVEESLLASPEAPIVLVSRRGDAIAPSVAPSNPNLGILLPYTPLHHLLLGELGFPVVATSGNVSDEPLCSDEAEAVVRLRGIADVFLVHDRPIARPVDDSVLRVVGGREMLLRRARGYAPFPVPAPGPLPAILAVGGHLKNTVALSVGDRIFVSPHVGDLETEPAVHSFHETIGALQGLYGAPRIVACDAHPDYRSTQYARGSGHTVVAVQHHHAHVRAAMADNGLRPPVLGFAWDGSGYGLDGTVWGGETLRVTDSGFERLAWLRPFRLPGGERAVREPRRSALGLWHELRGGSAMPVEVVRLFSEGERRVLRPMLDRHLNSPATTSAGRLFDGVAALLGLHPVASFEGQAAIALEFALAGLAGEESYDFTLWPARSAGSPAWTVDWGPMLEGLLADVREGLDAGALSLRFHNTLAEMIVAVALRCGGGPVVLSGGCFQNRYLTERTVARLRAEGLPVHWHRRIPPNDGGLCVGQVLVAARAVEKG